MAKREGRLTKKTKPKAEGVKNPALAKNKISSRSAATVRRLQMYNEKPNWEKMAERPADGVVRIEPSRKWFNNTRVVTQDKLEQFRETLAKTKNDPRSVLVKATKLPVSLFDHSGEVAGKRARNLLTVSSYADTFSAKKRQRKANLKVNDIEELAASAKDSEREYSMTKDGSLLEDLKEATVSSQVIEAVMLKGTSKRIWGELYKVVDSSDILIQVLDVRDPMGTRCYHLENHLKRDRPFKHMILLLNKCDLVPTWVTEKWIAILSKDYPTVAFKASVKHPFGKRSLIGLLRQFSEASTTRKQNHRHISVGLIGFPNVGKSSVINTLRGKKVCTSAPIPGETKVWQYVDLTSKVYLIDCPGIIANHSNYSEVEKVVRGVVRPEKLESPEDYIDHVIELVGRKNINKHYKISDVTELSDGPEDVSDIETDEEIVDEGECDEAAADEAEGTREVADAKAETADAEAATEIDTDAEADAEVHADDAKADAEIDEQNSIASTDGAVTPLWETSHDLLQLLARKWGKLKKGGEPHVGPVAVKILQDVQRGRLPWFIRPSSTSPASASAVEEADEKKDAEILGDEHQEVAAADEEESD